jgi:hypothetical protein
VVGVVAGSSGRELDDLGRKELGHLDGVWDAETGIAGRPRRNCESAGEMDGFLKSGIRDNELRSGKSGYHAECGFEA